MREIVKEVSGYVLYRAMHILFRWVGGNVLVNALSRVLRRRCSHGSADMHSALAGLLARIRFRLGGAERRDMLVLTRMGSRQSRTLRAPRHRTSTQQQRQAGEEVGQEAGTYSFSKSFPSLVIHICPLYSSRLPRIKRTDVRWTISWGPSVVPRERSTSCNASLRSPGGQVDTERKLLGMV